MRVGLSGAVVLAGIFAATANALAEPGDGISTVETHLLRGRLALHLPAGAALEESTPASPRAAQEWFEAAAGDTELEIVVSDTFRRGTKDIAKDALVLLAKDGIKARASALATYASAEGLVAVGLELRIPAPGGQEFYRIYTQSRDGGVKVISFVARAPYATGTAKRLAAAVARTLTYGPAIPEERARTWILGKGPWRMALDLPRQWSSPVGALQFTPGGFTYTLHETTSLQAGESVCVLEFSDQGAPVPHAAKPDQRDTRETLLINGEQVTLLVHGARPFSLRTSVPIAAGSLGVECALDSMADVGEVRRFVLSLRTPDEPE